MDHPFLQLQREIREPKTGIVTFLEKVCGLPVSKHPGQLTWLQNSYHLINILRPGNRFGKSFIEAGKHVYHAFTKIGISGSYNTVEEWQAIKYDTLNFGPGYEQAREVLRLARDIVQGNIHIPSEFQGEYGVTNDSKLKDWFIIKDHAESQQLPYLEFATGVNLFGRSYDEMGAAFKMKGLAFISGDECGDIPELWGFTNQTLIPRLAQFKGSSIDYVGTPQPEGHDYMRMIEMAEEDMARADYKKDGMFYVQKGRMYDNPFLDKNTMDAIERITDPTYKKQIVEGEYVETGDKYFGYERVRNAIDKGLKVQDKGLPGRKYLISADFAGGESYWSDYTVILVLDYGSSQRLNVEEQYRVVYFNKFKGGDISIPMQYALVEEIFNSFTVDGVKPKLIIDGSALGGKNASAFLKHLNPIIFEMNPKPKAQMLAAFKTALDGGQSKEFQRETRVRPDGTLEDINLNWGMVRIPDLPTLVNELMNYKLDDDKIKTDSVMALGQAIDYLEMRRPRKQKKQFAEFDPLRSLI